MTVASAAPLPLVPYPVSAVRRAGTLRLDGTGHTVHASAQAGTEAALMRAALRAGGAGPESTSPEGAGGGLPYVRLRLTGEASSAAVARPASEAYRLEITREGVDLGAATREGLSRGTQTLRQLLLACGPALPCCLIEDAPRFPWRGVMLDVARHFLPKDALLRMLDLAALHRLNTVHLHLTDDQGWRFEVPGRPLLTEIGSRRKGTLRGHKDRPRGFDPTPHGGFYTRAELAEITAYAADLHLTLVPEADMPGHVRAALAAYPELGLSGPHEVATGWGVFEQVLAPTEEALRFGREVLDTLIDVFDPQVVHLGGDECPRTEWRASPAAPARARELGLASADALQGWFHRELAAHLRAAGRRVAGWDEMTADGDGPPDALVMAWRDWLSPGVAGRALAAGHDIVQCPAGFTYLDHAQSDAPGEPLANDGYTPLAKVAAFDPLGVGIPDGTLEAPGAGRVLGVQAQLWSEYLPTPAALDRAAFPRLGALAEAGWTPATTRATHPFLARARAYAAVLERYGVGFRPLDAATASGAGGPELTRGSAVLRDRA